MVAFKTAALRKRIADALGKDGHDPPYQVVKFPAITVDLFGEYVCSKQLDIGGLVKARTYRWYQKGLGYLFRWYGRKMTPELSKDLRDLMMGSKRMARKAQQTGYGPITEGKREITVEVF
mmetsp:Transcript_38884/g.116926  ORF Transcript_38884/g.116926 Transcript_38884/m.116926 type:complete len:120 (-) Transcript_38884:2037-2396(-)